MATYRLDPKRKLAALIEGIGWSLVYGAFIALGVRWSTFRRDPAHWLPISATIGAIAAIYFATQSVRRIVSAWNNFELSVLPEGLSSGSIFVPTKEIRELVRNRAGVTATTAQTSILIPSRIDGFDDVCKQFSRETGLAVMPDRTIGFWPLAVLWLFCAVWADGDLVNGVSVLLILAGSLVLLVFAVQRGALLRRLRWMAGLVLFLLTPVARLWLAWA